MSTFKNRQMGRLVPVPGLDVLLEPSMNRCPVAVRKRGSGLLGLGETGRRSGCAGVAEPLNRSNPGTLRRLSFIGSAIRCRSRREGCSFDPGVAPAKWAAGLPEVRFRRALRHPPGAGDHPATRQDEGADGARRHDPDRAGRQYRRNFDRQAPPKACWQKRRSRLRTMETALAALSRNDAVQPLRSVLDGRLASPGALLCYDRDSLAG
jgi:hypothetical protein